jgi:hypothetical protein
LRQVTFATVLSLWILTETDKVDLAEILNGQMGGMLSEV